MGLGVKISPLNVTDIEEVVGIYNKFAEEYMGLVHREADDVKALLRRAADLKLGFFKGKKLIGYGLGEYYPIFGEGRILEVIVDPEYPFGEIAKILIYELSENLSRRGAGLIWSQGVSGYPLGQVLEENGYLKVGLAKTIMAAIPDKESFRKETVKLLRTRTEEKRISQGVRIVCGDERITVKEGHPTFTLEVRDEEDLARLVFGMDRPQPKKDFKQDVCEALFPSKRFMIHDDW